MNEKDKKAQKNIAKIDELKKRAAKTRTRDAKAFDINEFLVGPEYVQTKTVVLFPDSPRERAVKVRFGAISIKETTKLQGETTHEKGIDMLYRLLHQGDPEITKDQVEQMDSEVATELLKAITGKEAPLPESPNQKL